MNLRVNENNDHPKSNPLPSIHPRPSKKVDATIFFNGNKYGVDVKMSKYDLETLSTTNRKFVELYDAISNRYDLIRVDDISDIKYSKDEWEDN
ncbi:hypothetical protein [Pediococcus pentosaceus]|uniref:hypothetical protein n=1 Tax=Pediococcus pentosaceus TaxID=1255 RepID=UPI0011B4711C|nr:hypothetical protein [Pediococcus pentosaceus]QDZ69522.1 hypothetical protein PSL001_00755 [Pediococcus pentosaceus]